MSERLSSPPMNSRTAKVENERNMIPPSTLTKKNTSPKKWETAETKSPFFSGFPEKNKTLPQGTPFFPRHHERRRGQMTALCVCVCSMVFSRRFHGVLSKNWSLVLLHHLSQDLQGIGPLLCFCQSCNNGTITWHFRTRLGQAEFFGVGKVSKLNTKKRWKIRVGGYFRRGVFGRWGFT